jgi:hypothetical protein
MLSLVAASAALTVGPMAPRVLVQRAGLPTMAGGKQSFDNDMSGWKPPGGGSGGDAHGGSSFSSTDTPDFLPEEGSKQAALASGISFTDGMSGSQVDPNRKKSSGPEVQLHPRNVAPALTCD